MEKKVLTTDYLKKNFKGIEEVINPEVLKEIEDFFYNLWDKASLSKEEGRLSDFTFSDVIYEYGSWLKEIEKAFTNDKVKEFCKQGDVPQEALKSILIDLLKELDKILTTFLGSMGCHLNTFYCPTDWEEDIESCVSEEVKDFILEKLNLDQSTYEERRAWKINYKQGNELLNLRLKVVEDMLTIEGEDAQGDNEVEDPDDEALLYYINRDLKTGELFILQEPYWTGLKKMIQQWILCGQSWMI